MPKAILNLLLTVVLSLFMAVEGYAQYSNEWIRFNQQYFKIPVAKDGIYRLTYADLLSAGFPLNTDHSRIQLFHRGQEQAIHVVKSSGGVQLQTGDYLEFYGVRNTGVGDAELYKPSSSQPHQYYNLYSDTTAYFLTVNTQGQFGKRMEVFSEVNVDNLPAEAFHLGEKLIVLSNEYADGVRYNESGSTYVQNSFFEMGEGWTGKSISQGNMRDTLIQGITSQAIASGNPQIEIQLVGRTRGAHPFEISVGPSSPSRMISTGTFSTYEVVTVTAALNWSDISADGKLNVRVKALTSGSTSYALSTSYIRITFPQTLNMESASEKYFYLNANVNNKSFIQIQNAPSGVKLFDVTNPDEPVRIDGTITSTLNAIVDNTSILRKLFASKETITPEIKRISFRQISPSQHDYTIISHKNLMKPAGGYTNPLKEYGAYRSSSEGGLYDTLIVDIDQVYNQFNYGEISSLAITKFMRYMVDGRPVENPGYLFIIGKGLEVNYGYYRKDRNSFNGFHDLVPTAGIPSSDMAFTVGLGQSEFEPAVPTGRISASTPQQVVDYLKKVKEMEAVPYDNLWRKEVLHLSGGITVVEQGFFKNIMKAIGLNVNDFYLGGKVSAIAKNSPEIEFINISDKINSGVNLVTLLGHSGSSQSDFNIGYVSALELGYNNPGKYPMLLLNGCNGGRFFDPTTRYGEDWILTPAKGALGFMANTSFGYTDVLSYYTSTFYKVAYRDSVFIHKGVGDIQKEVVKRIVNGLNEFSDTVRYVAQAHQMFLLGDPAVRVFGAPKPDYEINDNSVYEESFTGEPITALSDSFAIKIIVRNFGRAKEDSLTVHVTQTLNDNSTIEHDSIFTTVLYSDTLTFKIPRNEKGIGLNAFDIEIDSDKSISELDETNNTARLEITIPTNSSRNLFPQGFSIVNTPSANLMVQSSDVLGDERNFIIQIDTVDTFDSPYGIANQFIVSGKIASQNIALLTGFDTLAYYWRSRFETPQPDESSEWSVTSFSYINNGPEGWAQVELQQYKSNLFDGLILNEGAKEFRFSETVTDVTIYTVGVNTSGYITVPTIPITYHPDVSVKIGGAEFHPISFIQNDPRIACRKNTINIIAFNKSTTTPYMSIPTLQYPDLRACGRRPEIIASYLATETDAGGGSDMISYVNAIQAGDSVILFSIGNPGYTSWSANAKNKLTELGISLTQINSIVEGEPVVIFAKKGAVAGTAVIYKMPTNSLTDPLEVNSSVTGRPTSGTMTSSVIGPAVSWQSLLTKTTLSELPQTDQFSFDVIGKKMSGAETVLKTGVINVTEDISGIDAEEYPYMKIVFHASDEINLTPPQLSKWLVTYTPAAEGVIVFNGSTNQQTLQEGEIWSEAFEFHNISQKEFSDSLLVQYSFQNTTFRTSSLYGKRIKAPLPGEQTDFSLNTSTIGKAGVNNVKVFVNPRILPEVYYENNVIEFKNYLNVIPDFYNPVMDVTVDGRYILNGDYVSSNPLIKIKLWDENSLIVKTDSLGVNIFLKYPCNEETCPFKAIYFTRSDVEWFAATNDSDFRVEFNPQNLQPGEYTLQVQAKDSRNNSSGVLPYEVSFVVADDNSILLQKPYPNPSSSVFFFPAVVAGDIQPDVLQLQIISSNGKIVGEFVKTDFFSGTNLISWEGRDASGNQLPDGLYLYRAVLIRDGKEIKTITGKLMLQRD